MQTNIALPPHLQQLHTSSPSVAAPPKGKDGVGLDSGRPTAGGNVTAPPNGMDGVGLDSSRPTAGDRDIVSVVAVGELNSSAGFEFELSIIMSSRPREV